MNSCVAFYIVSGFRLNQFKDHFETVRVTPLDNALAWDHTNAASTPWVHFAGDASRSESLNDLRYTEAFSAGEIFALHSVPTRKNRLSPGAQKEPNKLIVIHVS